MVMDGWMIAAASVILTWVGTFAVMRYRIDNAEKTSEKDQGEVQKRLDRYGLKIDDHSELLREHSAKIDQSPTMSEVRAEFVSKEFFQLHKEHIDNQFKNLNRHLDKHNAEVTEAIKHLEMTLKSQK
ncbi:MAG: hypothetical protein IBX55_19960 [Methyloprofundus sp.]|nr:hypothetical protein [Methyloprofundus sp.]